MGKTNRHEKGWGKRPSKKSKKLPTKGSSKSPLDTERNEHEVYCDELETEAYEEEYNEKNRNKGF